MSKVDYFKQLETEIIKHFKKCLTCEKELEFKAMKKKLLRCKKCQREYAKVWPETQELFYNMFKGQC